MPDSHRLEAYRQLRTDLIFALAKADALGLVEIGIELDRAYLHIDERIAGLDGEPTGVLPVAIYG